MKQEFITEITQQMLREFGKMLNIPKVHPHKFRRTLATILYRCYMVRFR